MKAKRSITFYLGGGFQVFKIDFDGDGGYFTASNGWTVRWGSQAILPNQLVWKLNEKLRIPPPFSAILFKEKTIFLAKEYMFQGFDKELSTISYPEILRAIQEWCFDYRPRPVSLSFEDDGRLVKMHHGKLILETFDKYHLVLKVLGMDERFRNQAPYHASNNVDICSSYGPLITPETNGRLAMSLRGSAKEKDNRVDSQAYPDAATTRMKFITALREWDRDCPLWKTENDRVELPSIIDAVLLGGVPAYNNGGGVYKFPYAEPYDLREIWQHAQVDASTAEFRRRYLGKD